MNTVLVSAKQPTLLITGATGTVGQELTRLLSTRGIPFRAMSRNPNPNNPLAQLPLAEVVQGDFEDTRALSSALVGIERAFLLTPSSEHAEVQQLRFVEEARKAGVRHIVKLSQLAADEQSPVRFLRYHAVVEQAIRQSGLAYTFLRPNLFMQGLINFRSSIIDSNQLFAPIGDASISLIDVRDIAEAAATALIDDHHSGKTYTLTGPESLTHADMAAILSQTLGQPISFTAISPETMRSVLAQIGFPNWQAEGLLEDYAHYSRNEAAILTSGVEEATGQQPRSFAQFTQDYASVFSTSDAAL